MIAECEFESNISEYVESQSASITLCLVIMQSTRVLE